MKLLRVGAPGKERPAILDAKDMIRDLSSVVTDIAGDALLPDSLSKIRKLDLSTLPSVNGSTRIGPCVSGVGKFICVGLNYSDHAAESNMAVPAEPIIFMKATSCISGPYDDVELPRGSQKSDSHPVAVLYARAVHPLLLRRAGPAQRRWLERGEVFFPYFSTRARFDTSATRAVLDEAGMEPVPPLGSYFHRLLDFAQRADWGRRPVPRSTVVPPGGGGVDEREVDSGTDPGPEPAAPPSSPAPTAGSGS